MLDTCLTMGFLGRSLDWTGLSELCCCAVLRSGLAAVLPQALHLRPRGDGWRPRRTNRDLQSKMWRKTCDVYKKREKTSAGHGTDTHTHTQTQTVRPHIWTHTHTHFLEHFCCVRLWCACVSPWKYVSFLTSSSSITASSNVSRQRVCTCCLHLFTSVFACIC